MNADPLLLLAGPSAVSLAPRLAASGYATLDWLSAGPSAHAPAPGEFPVAALASKTLTLYMQEYFPLPILTERASEMSLEANSTTFVTLRKLAIFDDSRMVRNL